MSESDFEIPYYQDYLSPKLSEIILLDSSPYPGVDGLRHVGRTGGLENSESMKFLVELYLALKPNLKKILEQRRADRKFIDERTRACYEMNCELGRSINDSDYSTVIGLEDSQGRIVFGPLDKAYHKPRGPTIAPLPDHLKAPHVTLFGPPDTAKMAINAMNAMHRKSFDESPAIEKLIVGHRPMWGADDEDSKTPIRADLIEAATNLTKCFAGTLQFQDQKGKYTLASEGLAQPIKRFPGLALPCSFLFLHGSPIPLHLYDFALHLFSNWDNPKALAFYVPKLENEEEAAYIQEMVSRAEEIIFRTHPTYRRGTVRLMIVLENPRAILRTNEIIDALAPFFAGASLGWHDYLASTARLFKEDANYRIPVKADPNIVQKYIKASHSLVANVVGGRGGIKVGGMYGILPVAENPESLQITLKGFIKDVLVQMKRNLSGFWVAHPDFVRLGLALVEAWKEHTSARPQVLQELIVSVLDKKYHNEVLQFIASDDGDQNYPLRTLLVADIKESDFIANNHPEEIRYNVFQSLQYLTDWLAGNGCVALPTLVDGIPVRVMDDLATAERSRWEVWAELHHGRFVLSDFLRIAFEEMHFIRKNLSNDKKIVQVTFDDRTEKWYPIAFRIMLKLMTDARPVEFATELLMPFTFDRIRASENPWESAAKMDADKFSLDPYVERFCRYFESCGCQMFADKMAQNIVGDFALARELVMNFSKPHVIEAAHFHGNIGEGQQTLEKTAAAEQALVLQQSETVRIELRTLGEKYLKKFGIKFLISAKGKAAIEIKNELHRRMDLDASVELNNAKKALWEITEKRLGASPIFDKIESLRSQNKSSGVAIAINYGSNIQCLSLGQRCIKGNPVTPDTLFEIASLSKTLGAVIALDYFSRRDISLQTPVNSLFAKTKSDFRLRSQNGWAEKVTIENLLRHEALNMHYVKGFPNQVPALANLLAGEQGYEPISVISEPGKVFHYSGGGFLVLQHLLESLENKYISEIAAPILNELGLRQTTFSVPKSNFAHGILDNGDELPSGVLAFPGLAAGAFASACDIATLLSHIGNSYHKLEAHPRLTHDSAVQMCFGHDRGSQAFMGCDCGLGVFVLEAGANRFIAHQGANDGFRALYLHCFSGPDFGKGFVILSNGDNNAVNLIADIAKVLLQELRVSGISQSHFNKVFSTQNIKQEEIVNLGYKTLLFDAFEKDLPEPIISSSPLDELAVYNLATRARVLRVSNQKFARAENLLNPRRPTFDADLYGRQGKIMDSWESVRHNIYECDFLEIELKEQAEIRFVSFSTQFHDGNHPKFVRLLNLDQSTSPAELLPKTPLEGHSLIQIKLDKPMRCRKVRVEIFPDGGLSRLGLFSELPSLVEEKFDGKSRRFKGDIPKPQKPLALPYQASPSDIEKNIRLCHHRDWASAALGGKVISSSNEHYGPAAQVISPFPAIHMFDGMESARSHKPDHSENVVIALGKKTKISRIILDFKFFVNNNPMFISIFAKNNSDWKELVPKTFVKPFAGNQKEFIIRDSEVFSQVKLQTFPDGGIGRIKVLE